MSQYDVFNLLSFHVSDVTIFQKNQYVTLTLSVARNVYDFLTLRTLYNNSMLSHKARKLSLRNIVFAECTVMWQYFSLNSV